MMVIIPLLKFCEYFTALNQICSVNIADKHKTPEIANDNSDGQMTRTTQYLLGAAVILKRCELRPFALVQRSSISGLPQKTLSETHFLICRLSAGTDISSQLS